MQTLLLLVGLGLALPGMAQWQWRDQHDKMVFSDRPPPADVPESKILRRPGAAARAAAVPVATPSAPATPAASAPASAGDEVPRATRQDKELEERRQQAQQQEAAKKAAEQQQQARTRADNCARARQAKSSYDSGVRIARTDAKGEREFVDDATRAAETRRLQGIIASECG